MAQVLPNKFTQIEFSAEEEDQIRCTFTATQLQFLQNFRAAAAASILDLTFGAGEDLAKATQEHAYQRGRIDVLTELIDDVAASQLRALEDERNSNQA